MFSSQLQKQNVDYSYKLKHSPEKYLKNEYALQHWSENVESNAQTIYGKYSKQHHKRNQNREVHQSNYNIYGIESSSNEGSADTHGKGKYDTVDYKLIYVCDATKKRLNNPKLLIENNSISEYKCNSIKKAPYSEEDIFYKDIYCGDGSCSSRLKLIEFDGVESSHSDKQQRRLNQNSYQSNQSFEMHSYYCKDLTEPGPSKVQPLQQSVCVLTIPPDADDSDITNSTFSLLKKQTNDLGEYCAAQLEEGITEVAKMYQTGKTLTICDTKKIVEDLGVLQKHGNVDDKTLIDITNGQGNEGFFIEDDYSKLHTQRKCWARSCWSKTKHSHVKRCTEDFNSTESSWKKPQKIFGKHVKRATKWDMQQKKAQRIIKESYENFFSNWQLWSSSLKRIEGQYGTGVVSFFIFLRWLLFLNLFIFIIVLVFIILPQILFVSSSDEQYIQAYTEYPKSNSVRNNLYAHSKLASFADDTISLRQQDKEVLLKHDWSYFSANTFISFESPDSSGNKINRVRENISHFCYNSYIQQIKDSEKWGIGYIQDFFQGTGWLELTLMFIGYYNSVELQMSVTEETYNLPVSFLLVTLGWFIFCLIKMLTYANAGVRETLLANEGHINKYCNMIFTYWDFCIEEKKAAKLKHYSILQGFKSQLAGEMVPEWSFVKRLSIYITRFVVNIAVIGVLIGSFYLIKNVAEISLKDTRTFSSSGSFESLVLQYLPSLTVTILNLILPIIFSKVITFEMYSKEFEIKLCLMRTVFIRLASIGILVASFYKLIYCNLDEMTSCLQGIMDKSCDRPICWETYVGQQIYKLVIMDFIVVVITTFLVQTPKRLFVTKYNNKISNFIGHQEFDIPSEVLAMVYSQGLCWLGTFYSPMIPAVCVLNLIILFYIKKFTLLKNCMPSKTSYKASRANTFFIAVLMLTFIVTAGTLGYSISDVQPSVGCSPFYLYDSMITPVLEATDNWPVLPKTILNILFSATFAIPAFLLLSFSIHYYITLASAHCKMITVLKDQLFLNGKDKQFLLAQLNAASHK